MGRQRNRPQMKNKRILHKSYMKWRQFIRYIIYSNDYKDTQQHEKRYRKHKKKDQSEVKNAISEINNTLEGINSKLDEAEEELVFWKTRQKKTHQAEQQKEKRI